MYSLNQIQPVSNNPGILTVLFISISALGIYFSIILILRDRFRGRQRTLLGLYALCLSILLLHLSSLTDTAGPLEGLVHLAGVVQLFLIGPFSFLLMQGRPQVRGMVRILFHLIPAVLVVGCMAVDLVPDSTLYALGMAHTGLYLSLQTLRQSIKARKSGHPPFSFRSGSSYRDKRFTAIQIIMYLGIGISSITMPVSFSCFVASAGIAILILLIWIRILYTAYLSYIISKS